jgi:hypothetical protein
MPDHIATLKRIKDGLQPAPDGFQQCMSYAALSKHTGIPERQLIRWITGKNQISPAFIIVLDYILKGSTSTR